MPGISLSQAQAKLDALLISYDKTLNSEKYKISDRELQRTRLDMLSTEIDKWDAKVKSLSRGGMRIRRAYPLG